MLGGSHPTAVITLATFMLLILAKKGPNMVLTPMLLVTRWRALPAPVRGLVLPPFDPLLVPLLLVVVLVMSEMVEPPLDRLPHRQCYLRCR
jgi:hypothetical protein